MGKFRYKIAQEIGLIVFLILVLVASYMGESISAYSYLFIGGALLGTAPVIWGALRNIIHGEWASMDMLASVALAFSLWSQEWVSSVFIALMLSAARLLSILTESRTESSIGSLLKLRPSIAKVEREGRIETVPTAQLSIGDVVVVDAGDRVPVDGVVIKGEAAIDESSLTGESLPVDKEKDSPVFSSTLVSSGSIYIRAEKIGKDTTLEKIIELVKSSQKSRPKIYTLGERFGKIYLVSILVAAGTLLFITHNTALVLAVVLVVCADDVAIAIPLAFLGAIGSSAKRGVIVKGGAYLEALARAEIFVFDKTGTLTKGALTVSGIYPALGYSEEEVLQYSAIASRTSKHPLSRAIVSYAQKKGLKELFPETSHSVGGKGVIATYQNSALLIGRMAFLEFEGVSISDAVRDEANRLGDEGKSISLTAHNGAVLGIIALEDEIKHEAKDALLALRKLGAARIVMLTGDNEHVARVVSEELGITEFYAGLLPEDKVTRIQELLKDGEVVMVGDGVNDAAALSTATVGIAMGAIGYDAAIESAHIVLMTDNLARLSETVELSRRVQHIAVEDFWIWGATNIFGLALVFLGVIGPAGAAAYNFLSDFFPLGNSLRTWVKGRSPAPKVI